MSDPHSPFVDMGSLSGTTRLLAVSGDNMQEVTVVWSDGVQCIACVSRSGSGAVESHPTQSSTEKSSQPGWRCMFMACAAVLQEERAALLQSAMGLALPTADGKGGADSNVIEHTQKHRSSKAEDHMVKSIRSNKSRPHKAEKNSSTQAGNKRKRHKPSQ